MRTLTINSKLFFVIMILLLAFGAAIGYLAIHLPERGRDTQRLADLKKIEDALGLYFLKYGLYPCGDTAVTTTNGQQLVDYSLDLPFLDGEPSGMTVSLCSGIPRHGLYRSGIYVSDRTQDPLNDSGFYYGYQVTNDRQTYLLFAKLEDDTDAMAADGGVCKNYYETGPDIGTGLILRTGSAPCL